MPTQHGKHLHSMSVYVDPFKMQQSIPNTKYILGKI